MSKRKHTSLLPILFFLALLFPGLWALVRCAPDFALLSGSDLSLQHQSFLDFFSTSVRSGQFPWWDASCMLGYPFAAEPISGVFYPLNWLYLLLPCDYTLTFMVVLHLWLAGVFTACLIRHLGSDWDAALLGGCVYANSGYMLFHAGAGHYTLLCAAAWLPALIWQLDRFRIRSGSGELFLLISFFAMAIWTGHPQISILSLIAVIAYAGTVSWKEWKCPRISILIGAIVFLGIAIAGPVLLGYELYENAARSGNTSLEFLTRDAFPIQNLTLMLLPSLRGGIGNLSYEGREFFHEVFNYAGLIPVLFAIVGAKKRFGSLGLLLVLGVLLATLPTIPMVSNLLVHVPVLGSLRCWGRSLFIFNLGLSVLFAMSLNEFKKSGCSKRALYLVSGILLVSGCIAFMMSASNGSTVVRSDLKWFVGLLAVSVFLMGSIPEAWRSHVLLLIGFAVVLDLSRVGLPQLNPGEKARKDSFDNLTRFLDSETGENISRIVFYEPPKLVNNYFRIGRDSINGYHPMPLNRFELFLNVLLQKNTATSQVFAFLQRPNRATRLAGVRWWMGPPQSSLKDALVRKAGWGRLELYEDRQAMPRAWIARDWIVCDSQADVMARMRAPDWSGFPVCVEGHPPELPSETAAGNDPESVIVRKMSDVHVVVETKLSGNGLLVLSDAVYPGWHAFVENREVPVLPANLVFRCVPVTQDVRSVEFRYLPGWRRLPVSGSILAAIAVVSIAARRVRRSES